MYLGGLDIGTTGCKLSVYRDDGGFVCNSYREYRAVHRDGFHEICAETVFKAVCEVLRETASRATPNVIGVTSFGETFAALDENDRVLLPSMLYTDPRGADECDLLCRTMGADAIRKIAGVKPHSMYSLPKLMWIKKQKPEIFRKIKRVMLMEDYIVYMLCGVAQIDYSLAARTMAFNIEKKCWSEEIFGAAGINPSLMSAPVPSGSVAGVMRKELAETLGIPSGITVVNGAHDQIAATLGAGVLQCGEAVDGTGTVECLIPVFDRIPEEAALYNEGYSMVPYVREGSYVCYALSFTGGAALKWFRENFAPQYRGENVYAQLDATVPKDPTGILVLPHFAGAATPYMDTGSRAAVLGLTLEHGAGHFYKALMEGACYEMAVNLERLESFGIRPETVYATGGGAASDVWLQIKADVWNRSVVSLSAKQVGACGTCMLCGVALGVYQDFFHAKRVFVKEKRAYLPDPAAARSYRNYYNAYRNIYQAVRPIVGECSEA